MQEGLVAAPRFITAIIRIVWSTWTAGVAIHTQTAGAQIKCGCSDTAGAREFFVRDNGYLRCSPMDDFCREDFSCGQPTGFTAPWRARRNLQGPV